MFELNVTKIQHYLKTIYSMTEKPNINALPDTNNEVNPSPQGPEFGHWLRHLLVARDPAASAATDDLMHHLIWATKARQYINDMKIFLYTGK
jgi:hypothetical protein